MTTPTAVARDVRRARSRARRERQSLGDALYLVYVTALVALYPVTVLSQEGQPGPGAMRQAVSGAEPLLVIAVAVAVVLGRCGSAVRGGPVVLPPEDARLLLTWPVPRRALVLPALLAALSRAVGGAVLVSFLLLYVDVYDLGSPAANVARDDFALPVLLSVLALQLAWLVQVSPRVALVARVAGAITALAALGGFCWLGQQIGAGGVTSALQDIADLGPVRGSLPFSGSGAATASSQGIAVIGALLLLVLALVPLSLRAAGRATPEQLLSRSRRADVTRTSLRLGFTSSVYLTRTEPLRRRRRKRRAVALGSSVNAAVAGKAFAQEQGAPVVPRLLATAAISGAILSAAAHVTPGDSMTGPLVSAVVAASGLTVVATRFADPIRLDVDRAPFAAAVPVPHLLLARLDLGVSSLVAFLGIALGAVGAAALGLVPGSKTAELAFAGIGLAVLLAAAGALGALSDDPSPFLPPWLAVSYRTSGFIAVVAGCAGAAVALRFKPAVVKGAAVVTTHSDRLPVAGFLLLAVGLIAGAIATSRAAKLLTRGR
ncbi:MAG: hypothetical protein JWO12_1962 [Frankiales bacterium]|nr:hypothetical protein [Frankiales bacterium]